MYSELVVHQHLRTYLLYGVSYFNRPINSEPKNLETSSDGTRLLTRVIIWTTNFDIEYASSNSSVLAKNEVITLEVLKSKIPAPFEKA